MAMWPDFWTDARKKSSDKYYKYLKEEMLPAVIESIQHKELLEFRAEQQIRLPSKKSQSAKARADRTFESQEQKRQKYIQGKRKHLKSKSAKLQKKLIKRAGGGKRGRGLKLYKSQSGGKDGKPKRKGKKGGGRKV